MNACLRENKAKLSSPRDALLVAEQSDPGRLEPHRFSRKNLPRFGCFP